MLIVKDVTKKYGSNTVLEDINGEFENGIYAFLSPNGAGKTTLIKMMATLLRPTSGSITWEGSDIVKLDKEYREVLGYLPQKFGYYKNETPLNYLRYLSVLKGIDKEKAEKCIPEMLEIVGLQEVMNKKMKTLSGGMIQRVGIAQALINEPKLIILDEPTAGLDPGERVRFRNMIYALSKDRIVILSTHIVSDVETIANKVIMIRERRILCCESPANICEGMKGKVFETEGRMPEGGVFLSERLVDGDAIIRFAWEGDGRAYMTAKPGLEDAYLYLYRGGAGINCG